jgi:hypothetical protein
MRGDLSGLYCVWEDDSCEPDDSVECSEYASDTDCVVSSARVVCKWDEGEKCTDALHCSDFKTTDFKCEEVVSNKGKCFYNGDGLNNPRPCSDVVDITE